LGVAAVVLVVNPPKPERIQPIQPVAPPQITLPSPTTYKTFAEVPNVPKGEFKYGGSTTWESVREKAEKAIRKAKPEFQLQHVGSTEGILDSSAGIKKFLQGEFTFSLSSRTLTPNIELQAQKQGINLKAYEVAINPIAVAVNPELEISGLTVDRLKTIYARKVTNWKEVGGPDLPIQIIDRPSSSKVTVETLTGDGDPEESSHILFVKTPTEALRKVTEIPGGIYAAASVAQVVPQCNVKALPLGSKPGEFISPYKEPFVPPSACPERRNQPNIEAFQNGSYPLTSKLYAIVKQNGGIEQQAGEAYVNFLLSDEGQKLLEEAGFVRIR
jgi:phosphate transport system substrate-binding protein